MDVHGSVIGGREVVGDTIFESLNPALGDEVVGRFAIADSATVEHAVSVAESAQPKWEGLGAVARGALLRRAAAAIDASAPRLAREIATEVGKPITEAEAEVARAVVTLYYVAEQARSAQGESYASDDPSALILTARRPLGVVGIITPWNFPLNLPVWKLAPALLWGNTVVWKPAEQSPVVALTLIQLLEEAGVPAGVVNVVFGGASTGEALARDRRLAGLSFTGSSQVGRHLAALTAQTQTRFQGELGGKNPLLVLADADLSQAAELIVSGGTSFGGQKCSATSRVVAHTDVVEPLCELLVERLGRLQIGDPMSRATQVGPLIDEPARTGAVEAIGEAQSAGAQLLTGGEALAGKGWFMRPALLDGGQPESPLIQNELFAPVIALQRASDIDHAVSLANASQYGFFVGVCTRDLSVVTNLASRLRFGIVRVNSATTGADPHIPFGGWRDSGNGRPEQGLAARDFYTELQAIYLR